MFTLVGADQKEYGPVPAEVLKDWIAQGRANGQTRVRTEGGAWQLLADFPEFAGALAAASPPPRLSNPRGQDPSPAADVVSSIIPYRNVPALVAYYLAVFSILPCVGAVLGLTALILGLKGLRLAREQPDAKGRIHAWIGIVVGGFFFVAYTILGVFIVAVMRRTDY